MSTAKASVSVDQDERALGRIEARLAPGDDEIASWARGQMEQELQGVVRKIWRRARSRSLDRGLSLSLPYFDDTAMEVRSWEMEVIPRGRIPFVAAFVVLAARREKARVGVAPGLSESTRRHLVGLLDVLEREFAGPFDDGGRGPRSDC
jgi:hypothetical protein